MKIVKNLFSLYTSKRRSKKRRTKRVKRSAKRHTRRVYKMRGGWGEPMSSLPEMFKKAGVMKGGWGGPVVTTSTL
jgi:hypothetical protein